MRTGVVFPTSLIVAGALFGGCSSQSSPSNPAHIHAGFQQAASHAPQSANVGRVFLDVSIDPARAEAPFRNAFSLELKRAGITLVDERSQSDAVVQIRAEAKAQKARIDPQKILSKKTLTQEQLMGFSAIDHFTAAYDMKVEVAGARGGQGSGTSGVKGLTAEDVMATLGNRLARRVRKTLQPDMASVDRIAIQVLGNDIFSRKLEGHLAAKLQHEGFEITNEDEADLALTLILNVSESKEGYQVAYMYSRRDLYTYLPDVDAPGWSDQTTNEKPDDTVESIAQLLACQLGRTKREQLGSDRTDLKASDCLDTLTTKRHSQKTTQ
jgi:hypothetical protein